MHIAYISMGAMGHVLAALPFCGELKKMGHRVSFFTAEFLREQVEAFGVDFYPVESPLNKGGKGDKNALDNLLAELPMRFLNEGACGVKDIIKVLENDKPDLIVNDKMAVAGRLAASYLNVPIILFFTSFAANEVFNETLQWPEGIEETPARKEALKLAEDLQKQYGGKVLTPYEIFASYTDFNIVTVDKRFQPCAETFPDDKFFFAGPQIAQRAGEAEWEGPNNGKKTVYASLGTVFNNQPWFWPILFDAVKDLDINLICSIGSMLKPEDLGEIPANVSLHAFLPQLKVLQNIDGFVSHAGIGSIMEATWFGVPTLDIPQMGDQFDTAKKVAELGIGTGIFGRENITSEKLRAGILDILDNPKYRENLAVIQKDMHENMGPGNAAKAALRWVEAQK